MSEQHLSKSASDVQRIHITDDLLRSPEGQAALQNYIEARRSGQLGVRKTSPRAYVVGEDRDFNVRTEILTDSSRWTSRNFTLRAANAVANVWVETELDGTFSAERMDELEEYILSSTPEGSFRADNGIIENDNTIFGSPPDVDGDARVDILLHDIVEGEGKGCCVLGYVTSVDADLSSPDGEGNKADILYVDLPNGIRGGVVTIAGTIAHEYQHLIHLAYQDYPGQELTFVNEGLSEWAEVMNGFFLRSINYLQDTAEHNTPLLDFRSNQSVEIRENDYQRAGLFTTYIEDRIGWEATGSIVQASSDGLSYLWGGPGYDAVLKREGLSLDEVVADFHTANFINDRAAAERFGYSREQRQSFEAAPTIAHDGTASTSSSNAVSPKNGAVSYVSWRGVADLNLSISGALNNTADARNRMAFRIFAEPIDGPDELIELDQSVTAHTVEGDFERVTLIVTNYKLFGESPPRFTVAAEWSEGGGSNVVAETVAYENGTTAGQPYFVLAEVSMQASRFAVPNRARLSEVHVAPVYMNQFIGQDNEPLLPPGLPRDFKLHVWADDGTGLPGEELHSQDVLDDPSGTHINFSSQEYSFLEVTLPESKSILGNLPDTVFIGISNIGSDENYLALTSAAYEGAEADDISYLYHEFTSGEAWAPFSAIASEGEAVLENRVLPIRARFLVATSDEDPTGLPETIVLSQNYPNPFNPTTSIEYSLPRPMHVRLAVYNVLGRRVATLIDGVQSAGSHQTRVDATGWASGLYVYALETETGTHTRRMVVVK